MSHMVSSLAGNVRFNRLLLSKCGLREIIHFAQDLFYSNSSIEFNEGLGNSIDSRVLLPATFSEIPRLGLYPKVLVICEADGIVFLEFLQETLG